MSSPENDSPTTHVNDDAVVSRLLTTPATWAVVGLSDNPDRTAYGIAGFLQQTLGMTIVPVHPSAETVHGEPGVTGLAQLPDDRRVDVVDCFVNSSRVGAVVDEAIAQAPRLGISAVWLQLGVVDEDAARRARQAGLDVVMDTCPRIEWPRVAS